MWCLNISISDLFPLSYFGDTLVPLEEDIHIASLGSKTVLKPHSAFVCTGRIQDKGEMPFGKLYAVSAMVKGFMGYQPGLMVSNSIAKMSKNRLIAYFSGE